MERALSGGPEGLSSKGDVDTFSWYNLGYGHWDLAFSYLSNKTNKYYISPTDLIGLLL